MRCQSCDAAVAGNAMFCNHCGYRIQNACPTCGSVNPQDHLYCGACGSSLKHFPAGSGYRLGAFLIDMLILFLAVLAVWQTLSRVPGLEWANVFEVTTSPDPGINARWPLIAMITLYHTIGVAVWSTTLGKKALGLQTLRPDGSRIGIGRAFARSLAYWCSVLFFMLPYLMIVFRRDKRGLHDLICDTVVVRR